MQRTQQDMLLFASKRNMNPQQLHCARNGLGISRAIVFILIAASRNIILCHGFRFTARDGLLETGCRCNNIEHYRHRPLKPVNNGNLLQSTYGLNSLKRKGSHSRFASQKQEQFLVTETGDNNSRFVNASCSRVNQLKQRSNNSFSLGGPFLVIMNDCEVLNESILNYRWLLIPIASLTSYQSVPESYRHSECSVARAVLQNSNQIKISESDVFQKSIQLTSTIHCNIFENLIVIRLSSDCTHIYKSTFPNLRLDDLFVPTLLRILLQWSVTQYIDLADTVLDEIQEELAFNNMKLKILLSRDDNEDDVLVFDSIDSISLKSASQSTNQIVTKLFPYFDVKKSTEIVEMVDREGTPLGYLPRKLVHKLNLLHRGIGIFVTRNDPILWSTDDDRKDQPSLYVHQRSAEKSIFPSLYDMFVGGVSMACEESMQTARREVAEELGLLQALDCDQATFANKKLIGPILKCTVCTAYNRCVVDLYSYTMNVQQEQIKHQEEEVQWGSFVPYNIVSVAADLSIRRLYSKLQWPSSVPPIQSYVHKIPDSEIHQTTEGGNNDNRLSNVETWDFVQDGLLVWEAWLQHIR